MVGQGLSDELVSLFKQTLQSSTSPPDIRAILARSENNEIQLVSTFKAQSTDKDDFQPCLKELLSVEKDRSGYVLLRLDTQSASGEWEWICMAYQPDGAKIREKMNYVPVRTSLLSTLGEHNFLATEFGSTPTEFQYPTKMRNARKHDYQNPQLKTAGKKASEAAGTDAGGARRNFGAVNLATAGVGKREYGEKKVEEDKKEVESTSPAASTTAASISQEQPLSTPAQTSDPTPEVDASVVPQETSAAEEEVIPVAENREVEPEQKAAVEDESQREKENVEDEKVIEKPISQSVKNSVSHSEVTQEEAESKAPEEPPTPATFGNVATSAASQPQEETIEEEAPRSEEVEQQLSKPTLPDDSKLEEVAEEVAHSQPQETAIPTKVIDPVQEQVDPPIPSSKASEKISTPSSTAASQKPQSSSSIGIGTSSNSILTSSEQSLANLKANEATSLMSSSSKSSSGSSSLGFQWSDDVSPALAGLGTHVSGSAEWNYVSISIDLQNETLELSEPPRFLPLGEISTIVDVKEPRYIFYRMESSALNDLKDSDSIEQVSKGQNPVVFIYSCPTSSSVKHRMLYSANRNTLLARVGKELSKIWIASKIETSDPASDLASSSINSELAFSIKALISKSQADKAAVVGAGSGDSNSHKVLEASKGFSRPRRPGAK